MKTMAFFSPLSPLPSGVAVYADRLAKELAAQWDITFYIDGDYAPTVVGGLGEVKHHREFRGREDMALYQASNGPLHAYMYPYILKYGGPITLHDSTLHDMVLTYWEGRGRSRFWIDFILNEGLGGLMRAAAPLPDGGGVSKRILRNLYLDEERKRDSFTFFKRVVKRASGIIAHSRWVAEAASRAGATRDIFKLPLAVEPAPPAVTTGEARNALNLGKVGIGEDTFVAMAYGYIQRHKRVEPILEAWRQFAGETEDARLVFVGKRSPDLDMKRAVEKRGLAGSVFIDDSFTPMENVYNYIYASDICMNLRKPVYGSTSQTLMEILSAGRACAVTDLETFSEFPDQIVKKVSSGDGEVDDILQTLRWARDNPDEREKMGFKARKYIESGCLWEQVGKKYNEYLTNVFEA